MTRAVMALVLCGVCVMSVGGGCAGGGSRGGGRGGDPVDLAGLERERAEAIRRAQRLALEAAHAEQDGDIDRAIDLYQQALRENPELAAGWNNLGVLLMNRDQETDAVAAQQAFQRAAGIVRTDPTPLRNLGILYQRRGFEEDALRYFEEALRVAPTDLPSLRGAVAAAQTLRLASPAILDRLDRAQMIEHDERWRQIIERERIRVRNALRG